MDYRPRRINTSGKSEPLLEPVRYDRLTSSQQLIHERIQRDLPSFNSQLVAAESIRSRLHALKDNTDKLSEAISNPEVFPHSVVRGC